MNFLRAGRQAATSAAAPRAPRHHRPPTTEGAWAVRAARWSAEAGNHPAAGACRSQPGRSARARRAQGVAQDCTRLCTHPHRKLLAGWRAGMQGLCCACSLLAAALCRPLLLRWLPLPGAGTHLRWRPSIPLGLRQLGLTQILRSHWWRLKGFFLFTSFLRRTSGCTIVATCSGAARRGRQQPQQWPATRVRARAPPPLPSARLPARDRCCGLGGAPSPRSQQTGCRVAAVAWAPPTASALHCMRRHARAGSRLPHAPGCRGCADRAPQAEHTSQLHDWQPGPGCRPLCAARLGEPASGRSPLLAAPTARWSAGCSTTDMLGNKKGGHARQAGRPCPSQGGGAGCSTPPDAPAA